MVIITPIRAIRRIFNESCPASVYEIPYGVLGVIKAKRIIRGLIAEGVSQKEIYFLGLCGSLVDDLPVFSVISPKYIYTQHKEFLPVDSWTVSEADLRVSLTKHYSYRSIFFETKSSLSSLREAGVETIDLEYSFIAQEFPNIIGIMVVSDNPLSGPKFKPRVVKQMVKDGIFLSIIRILCS